MQAKKSQLASAPPADRHHKAELELAAARSSTKQAKQNLKHAKKLAKQAKRRLKAAKQKYKAVLKERPRGKRILPAKSVWQAAARGEESPRSAGRAPIRRQVSRKETKAALGSTPALKGKDHLMPLPVIAATGPAASAGSDSSASAPGL